VSPESILPLRSAALVRHNTTLLLREPGPVLSRLLMPLVAVLVFTPLDRAALAAEGRASGTVQAVTGVLVLFSMLALSVAGSGILTERFWHTWDRLRSTPARSTELLAGKVIPALVVLLVQQALVLLLGVTVLGMPADHCGLLAIAVATWSVTLLCVGAALGTLLRSQAEFSAVQDISSFLFTSLGGALVPLADLPGWAQRIAPASPAYWAMSALHAALAGQLGQLARAEGVLLGLAVLAGALAAWRMNRGWGRSQLI
jgi:ABC-2 type transport system permease protein